MRKRNPLCEPSDTPSNNNGIILFEILMLFHVCITTFIQYFYVYDLYCLFTHPIDYFILKFSLIDYAPIKFMFVMQSRRLVFCLVIRCVRKLYRRSNWKTHVKPILKLAMAVIFFIIVGEQGRRICSRYGLSYVGFLYLPIPFYIQAYGFKANPFFMMSCKSYEWSEVSNTNPQLVYGDTHTCTLKPKVIRKEVELMANDVVLRIKQMLFSSIFTAYYASFLPIVFSNTLRFEYSWAFLFVVYNMVTVFMILSVRYLSSKLYLELFKATNHLGQWIKVGSYRNHDTIHTWSENIIWEHGSLVRFKGEHRSEVYKADGCLIAAIPENKSHEEFYRKHNDPSKTIHYPLMIYQTAFAFILVIPIMTTASFLHSLYLMSLYTINIVTLTFLGYNYRKSVKVYGILRPRFKRY